MRVLFICGSFEPGRDGVGDYVRQLSLELIRQGHDVAVTAINDRHISAVIDFKDIKQGSVLPVLRLPEELTENDRYIKLKEYVTGFDPDWLSLQYVPFSYHPKGLNFSLAKRLKSVGEGRKWQIMFHEICVGMHVGTSVKLLLWGLVQKYLAKDLIRLLKPEVIHTQVTVYKKQLEIFGAKASLLPLFSNIPVLFPERVQAKIKNGHKKDRLDLVVFGSIQHGAPVRALAMEAAEYGQIEGVNPRLVIIGRSGAEQMNWEKEWRAAGLGVDFVGERTEEEISEMLSAADFGIFTTPDRLVGKSGSVAAMREHGLHLLGVSRPWEARGINEEMRSNDLMTYEPGNLRLFFEKEPDFSHMPTVKTVAEQFIADLLTINDMST